MGDFIYLISTYIAAADISHVDILQKSVSSSTISKTRLRAVHVLEYVCMSIFLHRQTRHCVLFDAL